MSVVFTTVSSPDEVQQILDLQARNSPSVLTPDIMQSQGFVSVRHDPSVLRRMNQAYPSAIAKAGDHVVGYCLMMPRQFAADVPILAPMFSMLEELAWRGTPLRDNPRWFVMGQVCVDVNYRGQGLFEGMYQCLRDTYQSDFDFVVTEIAERNTRSLRAHDKVGFKRLHAYPDTLTGEVWHVVVWDWQG